MPARHRVHHSTAHQKAFTITLESCSPLDGIRVHDALETVNTMGRNMQGNRYKLLGSSIGPNKAGIGRRRKGGGFASS
jgi:hypothetical protein